MLQAAHDSGQNCGITNDELRACAAWSARGLLWIVCWYAAGSIQPGKLVLHCCRPGILFISEHLMRPIPSIWAKHLLDPDMKTVFAMSAYADRLTGEGTEAAMPLFLLLVSGPTEQQECADVKNRQTAT